ncbi:hypothetical protein NQ317_017765 [Molorchus minor]|uniref:CHK kinase-like domain-containing protein n=1 Tax=Molorchus minor TaxID=1323400 RepID=A0ABQ9JGP6_9CUCU|nr:hypothetical protein NQ317_017765 [Molorchus minor]
MSGGKPVTEETLSSWVKQAIENENIFNYQVSFIGRSEKGEGYLGEIVYVNVSGTTKEGAKKFLDIVIKYSKNHSYLRKVSPLKSAFRREIFIYNDVLPKFYQLQAEKRIEDPFDAVPKCFKTLILEDMEVLMLDNLKAHRYEMQDGQKTLNILHLKALLIEYAKLHALSFALKDQKRQEFESLTNFEYDFFKKFFSENSVKRTFQRIMDDALDILEERNDSELASMVRNLLVEDAGTMLSDLTETMDSQAVFVHNDCWNNNFMFQYKDESKTAPSKVAILDWQIAGLRSPVFDLSFLIYANSSKNELGKFDQLMETYYSTFSKYLRDLGNTGDNIPSFGLLFVPMVWRLVLSDKEEVPVFEDLKEGQEFGSIMVREEISDRDAYYERFKPHPTQVRVGIPTQVREGILLVLKSTPGKPTKMSTTVADLESWVDHLMVKKGIKNYRLDFSGSSSKGDGYLGEVNFLTVIAELDKGKEKKYNLVIKSAKKSDEFRKQTPIREAFEREIFMYTKILPIFQEFQLEHAMDQPFDKFAKCYSVCSENKREALVMNNLKSIGFEIHDRKVPQNLNHVLFVFQNYGKFHAVSLAMRKKKPGIFKSLTKNMTDIMGQFILQAKMLPNFTTDLTNGVNLLKKKGMKAIAEKYEGFENHVVDYLTNYTNSGSSQSVILHGDCWNNNMMFKYETKKVLDNIDFLLQAYYASLSDSLKELGCNAEDIFTFKELQLHWKKYGRYGVCMSAFILKIELCDSEEVVDFAESAEKGELTNAFNFEIKMQDVYNQRFMDVLIHFGEKFM